jgi:hypothetical protein
MFGAGGRPTAEFGHWPTAPAIVSDRMLTSLRRLQKERKPEAERVGVEARGDRRGDQQDEGAAAELESERGRIVSDQLRIRNICNR